MVNRRICIYLIGISLLVGCLTGCGKKENIELAEDVFLTISSTAKGEGVETYEMYTLHADISQNGQVRIISIVGYRRIRVRRRIYNLVQM